MSLGLSNSRGFLQKSREDGLEKFQAHNFLIAHDPEDRSFSLPRVFLIMKSKC